MHRNLAETVQSHPPASGSEHASTDARDSIRKWYIERGLYIRRLLSRRRFGASGRSLGGAFTIDEIRTVIASTEDPDSVISKSRRTKEPLGALSESMLVRLQICIQGREADDTFGERLPPMQPPLSLLRAAVRQTMRHVIGTLHTSISFRTTTNSGQLNRRFNSPM